MPVSLRQLVGRLPCWAEARRLLLAFACGLAALPLPALATGAAPLSDKIDQLRAIQALDQRIADIGWRLGTANVELCPARFAGTGISLHRLTQYAGPYRSAAADAFFKRGEDLPGVLSVAAGSPAWAAGIASGDLLTSINGQPLRNRTPTSAQAQYEGTDVDMLKLEQLPAGETAKLEIMRGDRKLSIEIVPLPVCASRFELAPGSTVNANSNGRVVQVAGGLIALTGEGDDLALVLAHELAHNALGHSQSIETEKLPTGLGAIFSGGGKKLRDQERDADRYGIFMSARAGFRYSQAADFWEKLTRRNGIARWWATTHPNAGNRKRNAAAAIAEVDRLKSEGAPLVPGSRGVTQGAKGGVNGP